MSSAASYLPSLKTWLLLALCAPAGAAAAPSSAAAAAAAHHDALPPQAALERADALAADGAEGSCSLLQTVVDFRPGSGSAVAPQRSLLSQGKGSAASAAEASAGIATNGSINKRKTSTGRSLASVTVLCLMLGLLVCMVSLLFRLYRVEGTDKQPPRENFEDAPESFSPDRREPPSVVSIRPPGQGQQRRGTYHLARPSSKGLHKPSPTVGDLPPSKGQGNSSPIKPVCVKFNLADSDDEVVEFTSS